jgi:hypothetical protein
MSSRLSRSQDRVFVGILTVMFILFGLATPGTAKCLNISFNVNLPDLGTLKLADGTYVIAKASTALGPFEARVTLRGGTVTSREFSLNGRLLKEVSEAMFKETTKSCAQKAALTPTEWLAKTGHGILDWLFPTAEADSYYFRKCGGGSWVFKTVECFEGGGCWGTITVGGRLCGYFAV